MPCRDVRCRHANFLLRAAQRFTFPDVNHVLRWAVQMDGHSWAEASWDVHVGHTVFALRPVGGCTERGISRRGGKQKVDHTEGFHGARRELSQLYLGQQSRHVKSTKRRSPFVLLRRPDKGVLERVQAVGESQSRASRRISYFFVHLDISSSLFINSSPLILDCFLSIQLLPCNICALD